MKTGYNIEYVDDTAIIVSSAPRLVGDDEEPLRHGRATCERKRLPSGKTYLESTLSLYRIEEEPEVTAILLAWLTEKLS